MDESIFRPSTFVRSDSDWEVVGLGTVQGDEWYGLTVQHKQTGNRAFIFDMHNTVMPRDLPNAQSFHFIAGKYPKILGEQILAWMGHVHSKYGINEHRENWLEVDPSNTDNSRQVEFASAGEGVAERIDDGVGFSAFEPLSMALLGVFADPTSNAASMIYDSEPWGDWGSRNELDVVFGVYAKDSASDALYEEIGRRSGFDYHPSPKARIASSYAPLEQSVDSDDESTTGSHSSDDSLTVIRAENVHGKRHGRAPATGGSESDGRVGSVGWARAVLSITLCSTTSAVMAALGAM